MNTGSSSYKIKIDWIVQKAKEMKDEIAHKKEVKMLIKEAVHEEIENIKQEIKKDLRRMLQEASNLHRIIQWKKKKKKIL